MVQALMKKLTVPSILSEVAKVQQQVLADAQAAGYSEAARFAIRLSLDEAMSNAIHHGNDCDPKKHITIEYVINDVQFRISVTDEGKGFRPDKLPDPTLDENLERPHGRGVMLMKAYMTEVSFNTKGNCVTLVKGRTCKLPH